MWICYIENCAALLIFSVLSFKFFTASPEKCEFLEKFSRNRKIGLVLAYPALIMCIPHAEVVAPAFLLPLLWPLALLLPVAAYFIIDYYLTRALGGLMILFAYELIHQSFNENICGAAVVTIIAWLYGFGAIWISGKPHALRDWFRLACRKRWFAAAAAAACGISGAAHLWLLIALSIKK